MLYNPNSWKQNQSGFVNILKAFLLIISPLHENVEGVGVEYILQPVVVCLTCKVVTKVNRPKA